MQRTLVFVTGKGGVGKTTSAVTVASQLASRGNRVLIVDLDPQCNATHFFQRGGHTARTILHVLNGVGSIHEVMLPCPAFNELMILPGDEDLGEKLDASVKRRTLARRLDEVRTDFDWVVIDTPPGKGPLVELALSAGDFLVCPTLTSDMDIRGIYKLLAITNRLQTLGESEVEFMGALVTQWDNRATYARSRDSKLRAALPTFETRIPFGSICREAETQATTVDRLAPRSKPARAYMAMVDELLEEIVDYEGVA